MPRQAGGSVHLDSAYALLKQAKTVDQLRQAQAVLLPLVLGLSIEQTALAIGRSPGATCAMRTRFVRVASGLQAPARAKRELRNRAEIGLERERQIIGRVTGHAHSAGLGLIPRLKAALEAEFGHAVALSSVYRLLARHGWRREAPALAQGAIAGQAPTLPERRRPPAPRWVRA